VSEEVNSKSGVEEIVGESPVMRQAVAVAKRLALSDAAILITGERGSGKELFARVIHRLSPRRSDSFIKVQLATTPPDRLESDLFGDHQPALDTPIARKIGSLELANKGTLFLDEVARLPLHLQAKLLRGLNRGEIDRPGPTPAVSVNLRLIASTKYDLKESVAGNRLHEELHDQFNSSSIHIPPLRERREDIPLLAQYFVQKFARRMNKQIGVIPSETMSILLSYAWPGNVAQLENFIERSVILTSGSKLQAPIDEL
jgi:formate hydrogenlyase transcriptional activator